MAGIIEGAIAIGATVAAASATEVAMTVALVGTATSVVGMATHNKVLSQIGMGLGLAGGIAGLGLSAGLIGGETAAASSVFETTGEGIQGQLAVQEGIAEPSMNAASAFTDATTPMSGAASNAPTPVDATAPVGGATNVPSDPVLGAGNQPLANPSEATPLANGAADTSALPAVPQTPGSVAPPAPTVNQAPATGVDTSAATAAPTTTPDQSASMTSPSTTPAPASTPGVQGPVKPPAPGEDIGSWWKSLDPSTKGLIAITGGQGVAGLAGGIFQGVTADQQLALQKLINQQYQNQVQYQNRNAAYAPTLTFGAPKKPGGLIGAAGGAA